MLLPIYTPTLTDEANVARTKCSSAASACTWNSTRACSATRPGWSTGSGIPLGAEARRAPLDPCEPATARRNDGFHAARRGRRQRKEIHKLADWLRNEPTPDIVTLPNSLLIGLRVPSAKP